MSIEIKRSDKYVDYNISAANNRGYITIDTSDWINKPWMFYELPALKFEIYTETNGELVKYQNFSREIRTYNPVYSPLGVLNVTIDIRNVPEEFILRITPIFDNDAIAARNMLIENGIENGDIWGSDQDVPTQLFNLDLEFIECEGEYVPPTPPVPPTHEETVTGVPPITFDESTGEPLVSWTILGNGQQTGTPSPDNIIMPDFVGVRTGNLWTTTPNASIGYNQDVGSDVSGSAGGLQVSASNDGMILTSNSSWEGTAWKIRVEVGKTYYISFDSVSQNIRVTIYTVDGNNKVTRKISNYTNNFPQNKELTILDNEQYVVISISLNIITTAEITGPMVTTDIINYEPFGYKIPITCGEQTTPVYLGQVQTVRKIKKLVLDGTENWQTLWGVLSLGLQTAANTTIKTTTVISDRYSGKNNVTQTQGYPSNYGNYSTAFRDYASTLLIRDDTYGADTTAFKSYLADQYAAGTPVTVWYVLAEPTTGIVNEPLAKIGDYSDELSSADAGVTIPTTEGQNTLTVDTDLQPSEMTITYIKEGQ